MTHRLKRAHLWVINYIIIGLVSGLGAVAFYYLCHLGLHFLLDLLAGYRPPHPFGEPPFFSPTNTPFTRWMLIFVPMLGAFLGGLIVYTFAPEAEGHGTDAAINAYHRKDGYVRPQVPIVKMLASFLTLGSGGSGGREGPIAQIGSGFGSFLATSLKLPARERRIMMAAGMAAGIGAIFRAPLAGALFAAEVLYSKIRFESEVIVPAAISSVVAYCVFSSFTGWGSLFQSPDLTFNNPIELFPYTILAIVLTMAAWIYVQSFYGVHRFVKSLQISNYLKPALGGLATGLIGFFLPETLAFGYGFMQEALLGNVSTWLLLAVGCGKIFTTAFSIGSGGSGGVFGPSVVIGGALGGAVGNLFHHWLPDIVTNPSAFVVVGMAGFFAAASKAPISTILMVIEMTGSYHLLLPAMLVCTLCFVFSKGWSIYSEQVPNELYSPAHRGDFFTDVLEDIHVNDIFDPSRVVAVIPEDMSFDQYCHFFRRTEQHYFPVVNEEGRLTGIFSINDVRHCLFDEDLGPLVVMRDIAREDIITTTPSEDVNTLLKKFTLRNIDQMPVVRADDPTHLLGMISRREVIDFYNRTLQAIKETAANKGKEAVLF